MHVLAFKWCNGEWKVAVAEATFFTSVGNADPPEPVVSTKIYAMNDDGFIALLLAFMTRERVVETTLHNKVYYLTTYWDRNTLIIVLKLEKILNG
jgi:hypothetical protein